MKRIKKNGKRNLFIFLMLLYPVLHMLVFTVYINFDTIRLCFQKFNFMTGETEYAGFYWFEKFFTEMKESYALKRSFINSLWFIPVTNFILLPLSIVVAFFLHKKVPGHKVFRVLFFIPSIISIVILTMCFSFMFDSTFGVVNDLLKKLGLEEWTRTWLGDPDTAMPMVFLYCVWAGIGYNVVLLGGAMGRLPQEIMEYGQVEGVGLWTELTKVVIPMIWPTISTLFITGTTSAFTIFMQPKLLTGGGPNFSSSTISLFVVQQTEAANLHWAATVGVVFSIIGIIVVMLIKTIIDRINPEVEY